MLATTSFAMGFAPQLAIQHAATRAAAPSMQEKSASLPFLKKPPKLDGSMAGDKGFDPLQISDVVPLAWSREAELKHARICMLAVLGWVAVDFGLVMPEAPHVSSLYAHDATVETGSFIFLLIPLTVIELGAGVPKAFQLLNDPDAAAPGDYKFDPLGLWKGDKEMQEKELSNGRLAMMAFGGIATQAALTGNGFPYTFNGMSDLVPPMSMTSMPGF